MPTGHAPKAGWQGEGEQEVRHGKKEALLVDQPGLSLLVLALGAMSVAAGVVPVFNPLALRAGVDVPTQGLGPTLLDGAQRTAMAGKQPVREALTIAQPVAADNFRQL